MSGYISVLSKVSSVNSKSTTVQGDMPLTGKLSFATFKNFL